MIINAAYYSSKGNHSINEDSISLVENLNSVIAIVADGLGGEGHGDLASRTAVKTICRELSCEDASEEQVTAAIVKANEEVVKMHSGNVRMKSTVAVLYISNTNSFVANVGDTRVYQFRKNKIIHQTIDHSVSQMSVNVGEIIVDELRGHIDRNKLTKALGSNSAIEVDITKLFLHTGDAFLLCSDGFWEHVIEQEMCEDLSTSSNTDEWLGKMRKRVNLRISPTGDNHSAIAIMLTKKRNINNEHGVLF